MKKIAKAFASITGSDAVQEVAANNSTFEDYDCVALAITHTLQSDQPNK